MFVCKMSCPALYWGCCSNLEWLLWNCSALLRWTEWKVQKVALDRVLLSSWTSWVYQMYYCISVLPNLFSSLHHCITVLLYYCITASPHHSIIVYNASLYYCFTVSLHHCISVSLYINWCDLLASSFGIFHCRFRQDFDRSDDEHEEEEE